MDEIWKINPKYPDYKISSYGRIFRVRGRRKGSIGKKIVGRVTQSGYRQVKLVHVDGYQIEVRLSRLVLETFVGKAPTQKHQAAHCDNEKLNNKLENLRWATPKENNADKIVHGTRQWGQHSGMAKLTPREVLSIRKAFDAGANNLTDLSRKYKCGRTTIGNILAGNTWRNLPLCKREHRLAAIN